MSSGIVFDLKEMAVHDGPGIRTTIFLKGCPLRCRWCHNPEGLSVQPQLMVREARCLHCGRCRNCCSHPECRPFGRCIHACPEGLLSISGTRYTASELLRVLRQSAADFGPGFGGFTFSGGEPLMQPDFLLEMLTALQAEGYATCIETSGYCPSKLFSEVLAHLDHAIMDLKLIDPQKHRYYTGVSNESILSNFEILRSSGKPCTIRTPLIPGITDTAENLASIASMTEGMTWEKLPYNAMAGAKYRMLGMSFPMEESKQE